jgi:hypothetical protein
MFIVFWYEKQEGYGRKEVNGYETTSLRNRKGCRCGQGSSEYDNETLVFERWKNPQLAEKLLKILALTSALPIPIPFISFSFLPKNNYRTSSRFSCCPL